MARTGAWSKAHDVATGDRDEPLSPVTERSITYPNVRTWTDVDVDKDSSRIERQSMKTAGLEIPLLQRGDGPPAAQGAHLKCDANADQPSDGDLDARAVGDESDRHDGPPAGDDACLGLACLRRVGIQASATKAWWEERQRRSWRIRFAVFIASALVLVLKLAWAAYLSYVVSGY
jgi:hypothetical protein